MIGLDTNVMVRYLVQDDPKQSAVATAFIEKSMSEGSTLWIGLVTLCEIIWVLEKCYELTKQELVDLLLQLLQTKQLKIELDEVVWRAWNDYKQGSGIGFSDCMIGRQNISQGCVATYTFDKKAAKRLGDSFREL